MPQAAVAAVYAWLGTTVVTYGTVVITYGTIAQLALVAGAVAYSAAQNRKMKDQLNKAKDTGRDVMMRDALGSRRYVYGRTLLAGPILFMATAGTKNENLHIIEAIAAHRVEELGDIYFDNMELVALDGSGNATGKYAGHYTCKKFLGDYGQSASPELMAAFPATWTANHRLSGIAYLHHKFKHNPDIWPNGMPTVKCMTKGRRVHDPRLGFARTCDVAANNQNLGCTNTTSMTVGMSVIGYGIPDGTTITNINPNVTVSISRNPMFTDAAQVLTFGSVAWSANPALAVADYLADRLMGKSIRWSRIKEDALIEAANECDEDIVTDSGTENRYECHGAVTADMDPNVVVGDLCSAMAGAAIDAGGIWTIRAGAYRTPTFDITDDDIVGSFQVQTRQSRRDTFNGVKGSFISPDNQWVSADFVPVKNDTYMAKDGNIRLWKDVGYPFTISNPCCQRLAKIDLEDGRQAIMVTTQLKLRALETMPYDTVRVTRAALGWTNKEFKIIKWGLSVIDSAQNGEGGLVPIISVVLKETAAAIYDWANGEETTVDLAPNTTLPDPSVVPPISGVTTLTDSTTVIIQTDGTVQPRIRVRWNLPNNAYVEQGGWTEIEVSIGGVWVPWNRLRGDAVEDWISGDIKVGFTYDIRLRHVNHIGVNGAWGTVTSLTVVGDTVVPNTPTNLVVVGLEGYVLVDWDPSSSATVNEYYVYRSTTNSTTGFSLIGQTSASQFSDSGVSPGTNAWYIVVAQSASGIDSAILGPSGAVTPTASSGGTIPSAPTAPTFNTSGTTDASDGSVASYVTVNMFAMPANAVWQNLLYKRNGATNWEVAAQHNNTGTLAIRVDDLTPGATYDFAVQAFSGAGGSTITSGTSIPYTAPTKTGGPNLYSGGVLTSNEKVPVIFDTSGVRRYGFRVSWAEANGDTSYTYTKDFSHWEIKCTVSNSDGAVDYNWDNGAGTAALFSTRDPNFYFYATSPGSTYVRFRAMNKSGVGSAWYGVGLIVGSSVTRPGGELAEQEKNAVSVTGITTGAGGSTRKVVARQPIYGVLGVTGGATSETINIDLTGYGFSTRPDAGWLMCSDWDRLLVRYDIDDSTSTQAVMRLTMADGTNLPTGSYEFTGEFVEYD